MDPVNRKNNTGSRLPGVLYTVKRVPVSQKEVSFGKKKPDPFVTWLTMLWEKLRRSLRSKRNGKYRRKMSARGIVAQATRHRPVSDNLVAGGPHTSKRAHRRSSSAAWLPTAGIMAAAAAGLAVCVAVVLLVMNMGTTNITVNDSGRIIKANTNEETVGEFLSKNGIALDDNDVLEVSLSAKLQEDMEIVIRRANTVTISDEDGDTQIKMLAGTVGEALERAGVELGAKDEVYPASGVYVYAGMKINVVRVDVKYETQQEVLEYKEITKESNRIEKGDRLLMQRGKTGLQEHTIEIVYKNGKEYSREIIDTVVLVEPVDEEIYIGTYVEPTPEPVKPSTKKPTNNNKKSENNKKEENNKKPDTGANNAKDDSGKLTKAPSIEQIHSGTWKEHKAVPEPASSIIAKTITATRITAYCLNKNKTATGTWPRIGTVAANPRQIPYGTKIYVPGYGYGRIEDTGSNKHSMDDIMLDLWLPTKEECYQWGSKRNKKVYILKG